MQSEVPLLPGLLAEDYLKDSAAETNLGGSNIKKPMFTSFTTSAYSRGVGSCFQESIGQFDAMFTNGNDTKACLANDCGIFIGQADHSLTNALRHLDQQGMYILWIVEWSVGEVWSVVLWVKCEYL